MMIKDLQTQNPIRMLHRVALMGALSGLLLIVGLVIAAPLDPTTSTASRLMCTTALMAGLLSVALGDKETNVRYRVLLLLLALWLLWTGLQEIVQSGFLNWLSVPPEKSFYAAEFNHMMWTLLGLLLGGFIFADTILEHTSVILKWFAALLLVLVIWGILWVPVLEDPEMLYKQPLVRDFVVLDEYLAQQGMISGGIPEAIEIARNVSLPLWDGAKQIGTLTGDENLARIQEVLDYLEGPDDYVMLILRPLNERDGWAALMCVFFLGASLVVRMFRDRPESAFIEKILLLLLLMWVFETLHAFLFSLFRSMDVFRTASATGFLISGVLFVLLALLLSRRIDFVTSIEGQYYERVLLQDATTVTRWVDRFDQFIIRRFLGREGPMRRLFTLKNK